jgi:hypothetical protein
VALKKILAVLFREGALALENRDRLTSHARANTIRLSGRRSELTAASTISVSSFGMVGESFSFERPAILYQMISLSTAVALE